MAWLLRVSPTILIFLFTFLSHQTEKYVTPVTSFHNTLTNHDEVLIKNQSIPVLSLHTSILEIMKK